jgi:hypothetical protein
LVYGYNVTLLIVKCGSGGQAELNTRHSSWRPRKSSVQDHLYKLVTLRMRFLNVFVAYWMVWSVMTKNIRSFVMPGITCPVTQHHIPD